MKSIEKTRYGFKLTFGGFIREDEMREFYNEWLVALELSPAKFHVVVDMRTLKPISKAAQEIMEEIQKSGKRSGAERSAVILSSAITKIQFKRIGKETGTYEFERYIDSSSTPN